MSILYTQLSTSIYVMSSCLLWFALKQGVLRTHEDKEHKIYWVLRLIRLEISCLLPSLPLYFFMSQCTYGVVESTKTKQKQREAGASG